MISLNNVTVAYGSFTLLDDISVHISESDKIGRRTSASATCPRSWSTTAAGASSTK